MLIKAILKGMVIGIANIIPGISGATLAISLGVYDKFIHAATHIRSEFKESMRLLVPTVLGAVTGIVAVARLVQFFFERFPFQTNLLFIGLILGGLPPMWKKVEGRPVKPQYFIAVILLVAIVIGGATLHVHSESAVAELSGSMQDVLLFFLVGLLSSATMVVPGISGSMLLMVLGYYTPILRLINLFVSDIAALDFWALLSHLLVMLPFFLGVLVGIIIIAKLLEYAFQKFPVLSTWAIMGLVVASPVAILLMNEFDRLSIGAFFVGIVALGLGGLAAWRLGGE